MNTMHPSKRLLPFEALQRRGTAIGAVALACLLGAIPPAQANGHVDVAFVKPESFYDAGFSRSQRDTNLKLLGEHIARVGSEQLRDGQVLKVEVLDVALAGNRKPELGPGEVRVLKGGADWPRITIRYSLEAGGKVLQSGTETIADLDYLRRFDAVNASGPLHYEKRMLSDWLKSRFPARAAVES